MKSPKPTTFQSLPIELRLNIWKLVWSPRRVPIRRAIVGERPHTQVLMKYASDFSTKLLQDSLRVTGEDSETQENHSCMSEAAYKQIKSVTTTTAELPVTLFINRESRTETRFHYKLAFALLGNESRVYFNFDLDHLVVGSEVSLVHVAPPSELRLLQTVTIPVNFPDLAGREDNAELWLGIHKNRQLGFPDIRIATDISYKRATRFMTHLCPKLQFVYLADKYPSATPGMEGWTNIYTGLFHRRLIVAGNSGPDDRMHGMLRRMGQVTVRTAEWNHWVTPWQNGVRELAYEAQRYEVFYIIMSLFREIAPAGTDVFEF